MILFTWNLKNKKVSQIQFKFVKQDLWIGLYWKSILVLPMTTLFELEEHYETTYYLCLIPCFPIVWTTFKRTNENP